MAQFSIAGTSPSGAVVLRGIQEAGRTLDRIGVAINGPEARAVIMRGAVVMRNEVERQAPVGMDSKKPRTLRRAVVALPLPIRSGQPAGAIVKVNYSAKLAGVPAAPHAHLVESGTKAHIIRAKSGKTLVLFGGKVFRESVQHPGARANPFFARGTGSTRSQARQVILAGYVKLIEATAKL